MNGRSLLGLSSRLPLSVDSCTFEAETLLLAGDGWYLRVLGPWRLSRGGFIRTSSAAESAEAAAGPIGTMVGSEIVGIQPQSRFNALDIALLFRDGSLLETFSDYVYDNWLLKVDTLRVEGPMQSSDPGASESTG